MARGSNQSVDTKFATILCCDAISMIESGRVHHGLELIKRAVSMLPEVGSPVQIQAEHEGKAKRSAFNG